MDDEGVKNKKEKGQNIMKKKIRLKSLSTLIVIMLMITVINVVESNAATYGDYEYTNIGTDGCMITKYNGKSKTVKIPEKINDLKVTAIGHSAFSYCDSITNVTLPAGVETIQANVF